LTLRHLLELLLRIVVETLLLLLLIDITRIKWLRLLKCLLHRCSAARTLILLTLKYERHTAGIKAGAHVVITRTCRRLTALRHILVLVIGRDEIFRIEVGFECSSIDINITPIKTNHKLNQMG
jgi:hypothetical protein